MKFIPIYEMSTEKDMPEKNCAIKFGGNVMPIQWGLDNDGKVVKDGNSFIFPNQRNLHERYFRFHGWLYICLWKN